MAELRLTVRFPDEIGGQERNDVIGALGASLAESLELDAAPRAVPEPTEDGQLHPMLLVRVDDGDAVRNAMRGIGAWYMHYPWAALQLKATGRGGRVAVELTRFSPIAFADAGSRLGDVVVGEAS